MIKSITKAFSSYSKNPFHFVWGSLLYVFLFIISSFAAIGLFLIYFMLLSVFNQELDLESIPTLAVLGIIVLLFLFMINGLNASISMAYRKALRKEKTSLATFFAYAMDKAPDMFGIMLLREFVWLLIVGPFIAVYLYFLTGVEYVDWLLILYGLFMTFVIHMIFTPSFLLCGGFDVSFFNSLRYGFEFLKKRHVFFIGLYIIFAFLWLLNFVIFIQIATIFFAYPVIYTAMLTMIDKSTTIGKSGED